MVSPVKAASVGIGWWSGVLADAVQKTEALEIVTCFTRNPKKRADFAKKYGCRQSESYEAIVSDPEVEAVLLTTPHSAHRPQVEAAAAAGKHVFVEKPLAHTVAEAKAAVAACERAGVLLSVGHSRRHQEGARKLKALIEDGTLGQVITAEANLSAAAGMILDETKWRSSPAESPGGPLTSFGIHHLDTLGYLLGPIKRISAFCRRLAVPVGIDDAVTAILEFESGALGYVGSNFATPKIFYLNVYGTEANGYCDSEGTRLFLQKKGGEEREAVKLGPHVDIVLEEMEEFGRCVRTGARPEVGGEEGIRAIAAVEAVARSAESGKTIALDDLIGG
ncbi:MAG: Gfo/Idh/MocA family protein [Nitrospinota bacterium]